jgi:predicted DNA-binding transcriptional regulator AlpA
MADRILSEPAVRSLLGDICPGTLQKLRKDKIDPFPTPVAVSARRQGWFESEVAAWIERRRKRRDAELQRKAAVAGCRADLAT